MATITTTYLLSSQASDAKTAVDANIKQPDAPEQDAAKNFVCQMLQKSQETQGRLACVQIRLSELQDETDRQITRIQEESTLKIAGIIQKTQTEEEELQNKIDEMGPAHQADLARRKEEMAASEQSRSQTIARTRAAIEQDRRVNKAALSNRRQYCQALEETRGENQAAYERSLEEVRGSQREDVSSLQASLNELQTDRACDLARMEQYRARAALALASQVSQARNSADALETTLQKETARIEAVATAVQASHQRIERQTNEIQNLQSDIASRRNQNRGTRLFGLEIW